MVKKGNIPWNKGKHFSEEVRRKISKGVKEWLKNNPHPRLGKHHTDEAKRKISEAKRGRCLSEEHKEKISRALKGTRNGGMFKKGHTPWNKGKTLPKELREKISKTKKGKPNLKLRGRSPSEETKKKLSRIMKKLWKDPKFRQKESESHKGHPSWCKGLTKETDPRIRKRSESLKGRKFTEEHRKHLSEACKGRIPWNKGQKRPWLSRLNRNPEFIQKRIKGLMKRPTEPERKLIEIIQKHSLPFTYSGDGTIVIGSFTPDFIHNYEKKVIEVFGRLWHDPERAWVKVPSYQQVNGRKAIYRKMGYDCLIIWDDEVIDEELVLQKITGFGGS